jgi:glycosyltransferase involved in cell wall biosynthesis
MALQACHTLQQQWHEVTLYTFDKSDECFAELQADLDIFVWNTTNKREQIKEKKGGIFIINKSISFLTRYVFGHISSFLFFLSPKAFSIITLAFHLRQFDIIIANNPPMQIVAALAKVFSRNKAQTIWWHHHVPWYISPGNKIKSFFERHCIIPRIDQMVATSHFVGEKIREYCGTESVVIHPVIQIQSQSPFQGGADEGSGGMQPDTIPLPSTKISSPITRPLSPTEISIPLKGEQALDRDTEAGTVTLFTHGRLEAGKGINVLVKTFQKIKEMAKTSFLKEERNIEENKEDFTNNKSSVTPSSCYSKWDSLTSPLQKGAPELNLIIFWTGSLETKLREEGIDVRPFQGNDTFQTLSSWQFWHVIGVYCSSIDAFGMASLESQMAGFPTVILDRGGAREAILSDDDDYPVGYLVQSEEELWWTISRYVQNKILEKQMSNVNFSHKRDYFSPERLSRDLLSIITKIGY